MLKRDTGTGMRFLVALLLSRSEGSYGYI